MSDLSVFAPNIFKGKCVLISGGGSGIGFAIAEELGKLGARVILSARDVERLERAAFKLKEKNIEAYYYPVNIREEHEVISLFKTAFEKLGGVDFLVNNAGGQFAAPALDVSANGFRSVVDLNLQGTWHMSSIFARHLIEENRAGKMINIVLCLKSGIPGMVHASAARAGVVNMTKTLAYEWGPYNINVNAIAPGTIETGGLENYNSENLDKTIRSLPIKRMGTPNEVATAISYLLSPAGDFITGTTLEIDGGEHLIGAQSQI
ncbi:SDR family oxidoreductase [Anaerobacillus sp. MEB173]|uniref:SDR family oxidoreductase n=1 Tax=Anaerobacillus sp. MEB173 TaxID=3383345 RepID=UPI003F92F331